MNDKQKFDEQAYDLIETIEDLETGEIKALVKTAYVVARLFPRREKAALKKIINACQDSQWTRVGLFAVPNGDDVVLIPTLKLTQMIAGHWGNLEFGIRECEHAPGVGGQSLVEAFCIDLQKNIQERRRFYIQHAKPISKIKGAEKVRALIDPSEVYSHVANYGARRMRACMLGVIPLHVQEEAISQISSVLIKETFISPGEALLERFRTHNVSEDMLDKWLGYTVHEIKDPDFVNLHFIEASLAQGETRRADWFDLGEDEMGGKAAELNQKLKSKGMAAK